MASPVTLQDRAPTGCTYLELSPYLNAIGATSDETRPTGAFNAWGNSFPAEELWFGGQWTVGNVSFALPPRTPGAPDHIEALSQVLAISPPCSATFIAFLCCGEMGPQELPLAVMDTGGRATRAVLTAPGWLVNGRATRVSDAHLCTHLHFPGDYELALLKPALWCVRISLPSGTVVSEIRLGDNPLVHIFALTLMGPEVSHA